jgi:hypothetical protein
VIHGEVEHLPHEGEYPIGEDGVTAIHDAVNEGAHSRRVRARTDRSHHFGSTSTVMEGRRGLADVERRVRHGRSGEDDHNLANDQHNPEQSRRMVGG